MLKKRNCKKSIFKNKSFKNKLLILLLGCCLLNSGINSAQAKVWQVGSESQLRQAMSNAQAGDTIQISKNIILSGTLPNMTVSGVVIDGKYGSVNLNGKNINITGDLAGLQNISLRNGGATFGGGVYVGGNLTGGINSSSFISNTAGSGGGGGVSVGGNLTGGINSSSFISNTAGSGGGGGVSVGGNLTGGINSSSFISNTAGVYVWGNLTGGINSSSFISNTAGSGGGHGGGVSVWGNLTGGINSSSFISNTAAAGGGGGGGVYVWGNLTGGINSSSFISNTAAAGGGVSVWGNLTGGINSSSFISNTGGGGGGVYVGGNMDIVVNKGATTLFYNNRDTTGTNSMYFDNNGGGKSVQLNVQGSLLLYDPIRGNNLPLTKTGSGLLLLGGNSDLGSGNWNIQAGKLVLTYDSANALGQINTTGNFNLNSGAIMQIVPTIEVNAGSPALINAANINLHGRATVGSDYRYIAKQNILGANQTLLQLNNAYTGAGQLSNTSGSFALGQYDYEYDNLHWANPTDLVFNIKRSYLSPERTGGYTADGAMRTRLSNNTNSLVFGQMQNNFTQIIVGQNTKNLTTSSEKTADNMWGTFFHNNVNNDQDGIHAGSRAKVPGLILGTKLRQGNSSFNGIALAMAWPDYRQGNITSNGKDFRLNFYGGKLLKKDIQFGYLFSVGMGDMSQQRQAGGDNLTANYDVTNYTVGISFAKDIYKSSKKIIRPFMTYEYIKIKSDGYTEAGSPLTGITASGSSQDISRVKLGVELNKQGKNNSYLKYSIYYQGLFGDTAPDVYSFMTNTPNSGVYMSGSGVDKNAIGFSLAWGKKMSEKLDWEISYNGLVGSKAMSNDFKVTVNYKF